MDLEFFFREGLKNILFVNKNFMWGFRKNYLSLLEGVLEVYFWYNFIRLFKEI